ncbi:MAG: hypothetical protein H7343_02590 [Undibacterium sp.]|nr:hypothetical protein [Opitutaceae bacterium]
MKPNLYLLSALLATSAAVIAAPLTETTAVHTKPNASSPVVNFFKAGTEPAASPDSVASTPAGWMAVELPGPFEAYVLNKDLTKGLDVVPGANLALAPKVGAPILTVAAKGDKTTITGLHGKWTQVSLERKLVGYIPVTAMPGYLPAIATTVAPRAPASIQAPPPMSAAPAAPVAYGNGTPGHAAPMVNLSNGGASSLPRQFSGKLVSTRRAFTPRRPFDWALNDDAGRRYAYLDVSKLLLTEQIEKYIDHSVVVYGAAKNAADGKDIVIEVESLQLR